MFRMKKGAQVERPPSRSSSARGLRKSTLSVRSGKSNASKDSRKSLSARKRQRDLNAISQENLRLVANLVNVKPMIPVTSSKKFQNGLKQQSRVRESLREIRYGTPTHRSSKRKGFDLRTDLRSSSNHYDSPTLLKSKVDPVEILKKRGLSNMAKMFDIGDRGSKSRANNGGAYASRPSSRSSERSLPARRIKKGKKRGGNMQYGRKIIIDTGGDFSEGNRPHVRAQRVRVKNTA